MARRQDPERPGKPCRDEATHGDESHGDAHGILAGIDVHSAEFVAAVIPEAHGRKEPRYVECHSSFRRELEGFVTELVRQGVARVAMEATGVYWFRLWQLLDDCHIEVLVVNPQHSKAVKGRKADRKDAKRLAYALKNGTLEGSFVAGPEQRALRSYTRGRVGFVRSATAHKNRIHKILRAAGIPLNDVLSDVFCDTGRVLLRQLATGQHPDTSDEALKKLPKKTRDGVREALDAGFDIPEPDRELLALELAALDHAWNALALLHRRIQAWLEQRPVWRHAVALVDSIPGVAFLSAASVVAEIGLDMQRFPTADHLASWSGLCPGQHESAGRNLSGSAPPGNPYVKRCLVECAQTVSARQVKESDPAFVLNRLAYRLRSRKPWNKAVVAVAHRMILLAWILLRFGEEYDATIHGRYRTREEARRTRRSIRQLEREGWRLIPPSPSAA